MKWPDSSDVPVNYPGSDVRDAVWTDLTGSKDPLVVAGFASIARIVDVVHAVAGAQKTPRLRVLLGTEPFATERLAFGSADISFTTEVRRYWIEEHGISLLQSATIVEAIQALDEGWFDVRSLPGRTRLHAKIYVGDDAVTVGSSNFTENGLRHQYEANVRVKRATDRWRYDDIRLVADNYWSVGRSWTAELRRLLQDLLQFVTWREALSRASAELLEGQWAGPLISNDNAAGPLWPSQVAGIAEALWVIENVGSVLVADATGSGKTRMGAHLTRAVQDRLWRTGRMRGGLTALVCPPTVKQQWDQEARRCGLMLHTVSHGLLSRPHADGARAEEEVVATAQILAIDEAHNFLSRHSRRTELVRASRADHVLMFTATPINRGAEDLLSMVDLLGADNFDDETLVMLDHLSRRGGQQILGDLEKERLRREIQRFTVRRTKTVLNAMVDREPDAYRDPVTDRVCRYPEHDTRTYPTGEIRTDQELAQRIRTLAAGLVGVCLLGDTLEVPAGLRREYNDQRWMEQRLAAGGLAAHHVLSAMRSSTAALLEHVVGTRRAVELLDIIPPSKATDTGDMVSSARRAAIKGPPATGPQSHPPDWLADQELWRTRCEREALTYDAIAETAMGLSLSREQTKAKAVLELAATGRRVLAFDRHPITLAVLQGLLEGLLVDRDLPVVTATGGAATARKRVEKDFARGATGPGIALCTEAMNEGINLQGAAAVVHLDMPTTLRVAEQRVGRVDRMDSPHDRIEVWWPEDGTAFATHADELLRGRNLESTNLLGSNLPIPYRDTTRVVRPDDFTLGEDVAPWDGLRDALDPVRKLVHGPHALLNADEYEEHRRSRVRVAARVSPVRSTTPWAFFAVTGARHGAPRWLLLESGQAPLVDLQMVTARLRELLLPDPPSATFDEPAGTWLAKFLQLGQRAEESLLPRRDQRALAQLRRSCSTWTDSASRAGEYDLAERWRAVLRLLEPVEQGEPAADLHEIASTWWRITGPHREAFRRQNRHRRYTTLSDIDGALQTDPLPVADLERALSELSLVEPFDRRVSACILGVPSE